MNNPFIPYRYKALDELKQTEIRVTQDEFPDKTALNDKGEWYEIFVIS